jgi:hypothetical protein
LASLKTASKQGVKSSTRSPISVFLTRLKSASGLSVSTPLFLRTAMATSIVLWVVAAKRITFWTASPVCTALGGSFDAGSFLEGFLGKTISLLVLVFHEAWASRGRLSSDSVGLLRIFYVKSGINLPKNPFANQLKIIE